MMSVRLVYFLFVSLAAVPGLGGDSAVFVLDTSGSMAGENAESQVESVGVLIPCLPATMSVGVVTFNHEARVLHPLTPLPEVDRGAWIEELRGVAPNGGTDILAGVQRGLELLETGGALVVLGDGFQTGNGKDPQPQSIWGESARSLAERARIHGVVIHSIALGPDVEADPLLQLLAADTGGQFLAVREARDLVSKFVSLASQFGSYWVRSSTGGFEVTSPENVLLISDASERLILREWDGRTFPVMPSIVHGGRSIQCQIFQLDSGQYEFRIPDVVGHAYLLRPMRLKWELPSKPDLPAARNTQFEVQAVATVPGDLDGLELAAVFQFGGVTRQVQATCDEAGRFPVSLRTPELPGPYSVTLESQQNGWVYRAGSARGSVVPPPPLNVQLKVPADFSTGFRTRAIQQTIVVEGELACDSHGHNLVVHIGSTDPRIEVSPKQLTLQTPRQTFRLVLRYTLPGESATIDGALRVSAETDDLVPATVNGRDVAELALPWRHTIPALNLWLDTKTTSGNVDTIRMARGGEILIPVLLQATDWEDASVELMSGTLPPGVEIHTVVNSPSGRQPVRSLRPDPDQPAALRVSVANSAMPGSYAFSVFAQVRDPEVLLNGLRKPWATTLKLSLDPVNVVVQAHFAEDRNSEWRLTAPVEFQSELAAVEVHATDGGPLPSFEIVRVADQPVAVQEEAGNTNRYLITIPAQAAPFEARVRFQAVGRQINCVRAAELAVRCEPVTVTVAVGPVEIPRYCPWAEYLFGRPPADTGLVVTMNGEAAEMTSWEVWEHRPDGVEERLRPTIGERFRWQPNSAHEVYFRAAYEHAQFSPAARLPIAMRDHIVPIPRKLWIRMLIGGLAMVGVAVFVGAFLWSCMLVKVSIHPDAGIYKRLWCIRLERLTGSPDLRLRLFRSRLRRLKKDQSGQTVTVHSQRFGHVQLNQGDEVRTERFDVVEVNGSKTNYRFEVLTGPKAKKETGRGEGPLYQRSDIF